MKKVTMYALKLVEGKYYIGMTRNMERRYREHEEGGKFASQWTNKYKPIEILETHEYTDDRKFKGNYSSSKLQKIENQLTLEYMEKCGWNNVRGGSWSIIDIKEPYALRNKSLGSLQEFFV